MYNIFILSAGRTRTRWARTARAWAWIHRGWSLTGADSKTIKNSFDILALTFYTGYFTFFHLFDSCSNLKSFMAVLTFKIIVWHRNFSFFFILFLSTLFSIFIYTPNYPFCQEKNLKNLFTYPLYFLLFLFFSLFLFFLYSILNTIYYILS